MHTFLIVVCFTDQSDNAHLFHKKNCLRKQEETAQVVDATSDQWEC